MDSEKLKLAKDDKELNKLMRLRRLLHMIRSLVIHAEAGEDMYEDVKELVTYVTNEIEPRLNQPTCNIIEFYKRCTYMMLKYACEDFVKAVEARRNNIPIETDTTNKLLKLQKVHNKVKELCFDSTYSLWTDSNHLASILKSYCKILSHVVYNKERDEMDDSSINKKLYQPCVFCQRDASLFGVGRIEGSCEETEKGGLVSETFTNFVDLKYNNLCCHYVGDTEKYKTSWDKLLSK